MAWLAGERITAARLSQDSDIITLTNDVPAATSTWEDYGTETVVFSDPGVGVKVKAWASCAARNTVSAGASTGIRIGISVDGGSTFVFSAGPLGNVGVNTEDQREQLSTVSHRAGTPTGGIVIKVQLFSSSVDTDFQTGELMAEVVPQ